MDEVAHIRDKCGLPGPIQFIHNAKLGMDTKICAGLPDCSDTIELVWFEQNSCADRPVFLIEWAVHWHEHVEGIRTTKKIKNYHSFVWLQGARATITFIGKRPQA